METVLLSARARKLGDVIQVNLNPDMHWYHLSLARELAKRLPGPEHHRGCPNRIAYDAERTGGDLTLLPGVPPCGYPQWCCLPERWLNAPDPLGRYLTPQWAIDLLVRHWPVERMGGILLEPGCGDGRIARTLIRAGICDGATGIERDPNMANLAFERGLADIGSGAIPRWYVTRADFLSMGNLPENADTADVGFDASAQNPPYEPAEAFVRKTLANVREGAFCAVLLRLGWLAGLNRLPFWQGPGQQLERVIVLPRRPQFERPDGRKMGSDQTDYMWAGWVKGKPGGPVHVIHPEVS